jgi:protein transport protein DSL1/ZW10
LFSQAIPDVPSKLIDFQDIMRNTAEFEEGLRKMHFISDDNKDRKLSQYVDNVELHFASKKRNELLVNVRSILKDFSYDDPPVSLL